MVFFDHSVKSTRKQTVTEDAKDLARRHRKWCASHQWYISKQAKMWEVAFQRLLNQVGTARVSSALIWYHANHGTGSGKFNMRLKNGDEFRNQFGTVEDFAKRAADNHVEVTNDTKETARPVTRLNWPKGSGSQVLPAFQITLDSWWAFWRKVRDFVNKHPTRITRNMSTSEYAEAKRKAKKGGYVTDGCTYTTAPDHVLLAHEMSRRLRYSIPQIVVNHFRQVFMSVYEWEDWSGNLIARAWRGDLDDKAFDQVVCQISTSYTDGTKAWERLKEELQ